jgi:hypothetical protein
MSLFFRLVYANTSLLSDEPDLARDQIEQILRTSKGGRDWCAKSEDFMRRAFCGPSAARSWG